MNHSQSTQSNKIAIPLQYLKKEVRDGVIFCTLHDRSGQACSTCSKFFYCDTKHSDIFRGSSHVCCYLITINLTFFWTLIEYAIISLVFWKIIFIANNGNDILIPLGYIGGKIIFNYKWLSSFHITEKVFPDNGFAEAKIPLKLSFCYFQQNLMTSFWEKIKNTLCNPFSSLFTQCRVNTNF